MKDTDNDNNDRGVDRGTSSVSPENKPDYISQSSEISGMTGRGQNPASQANLKPYPKGVSGNPSGKPKKGASFIKALKEQGKRVHKKHQTSFSSGAEWISDEGTYNYQVVDRIWGKARQGDLPSIKLLFDMGALDPSLDEVDKRAEKEEGRWDELAEKIEKGQTQMAVRRKKYLKKYGEEAYDE